MQSETVAYMFGGLKFHDAALAIAIMAFYQIHQTYGVLSGAVFMASGQTALYSKIGIITMLIGIPICYFMIAPANKLGLHAGATGLAIKMVIVQCIGVNVQLFFNCRFLKLNFWRYVGHQIICVLNFLLFSAFATYVVNNIFILINNVIIKFLLSGIIYTAMVLVSLYFMPILFGLNRMDITSMRQLVFNKIWSKVDE